MKFSNRIKTLKVSLFLFLLVNKTFAQEGSTYVMSNASISIPCDAWIVDPDSLRGNYPFEEKTMIIQSLSGSKMGIQVDSCSLREDMDYIRVYDGPSISSPLLSVITRSNWTDPGFKSSGPVITIVFRGYSSPLSATIWGWRLRIRCIQDIEQTADFLSIPLENNNGNIQLSDYDKDGDKDVLAGGIVYRNDSKIDSLYVFDKISKPLGNWRNSNMVAADFDNDGFKDVFITGDTDASGVYTRRAMIFKNVNGVFSAANSTSFIPATGGAVSVVDFNKDNRPDIAYSGYVNGAYFFKLYLNNGNFNFTEKETGLPGLIDASMSWLDYDNDGDIDLLYNGREGTIQPRTGLFINNADNSFTYAGLIMNSTNSGDIKWVDVDMDGRYDIVNTGGIVPEILFNNGDNSFTRVITNIPSRSAVHHDWADFDNDGDMDMVLTGSEYTNGVISQDAAIYKNNGNGNFTKISVGDGSSLATPKWIDLNNDAKWDVFIPARDIHFSMLYKNMGADSFQAGSYPFTAFEFKGTALAEDFTNDGFVDVLLAGELNDHDCNEGNNSVFIKSLGWSVFPVAKLTKVADMRQFTDLYPWLEAYWRWGDIDSDGWDDILLSGDGHSSSSDSLRIFKNNGNDNFSLIYTGFPLPNHYNNQVGVVDIDNDGVNELYLAPNKLCRWNGAGFTILNNDVNYCGPDGCNDLYYDFADFNNDGLMDVAYSSSGQVYILKNNGAGKFEYISGGWADGHTHKYIRWADFDHDGDPDLLTDYGILENTSWGGFRYRDVDIPEHEHTGIADLNDDGWLDIFTLQYRTEIGPSKLYYNQQGKIFFEDKTPVDFAIIPNGVYHQGAEAFDIDSDGDNDLIYISGMECNSILLNNNNIRKSNLKLSTPNGNENYEIGSGMTIKWIGSGLSESVKVEVSLDSGLTWTSVATNAPGSRYGGQFEWLIKSVEPSTKCLVRVMDNKTGSLSDISDKTFALSKHADNDPRNISVSTPNGNETYNVNTNMLIKWIGNNIGPTVKIDISSDSGITWEPIVTKAGSSGNGGQFEWSIKGVEPSTKCLIKITDNEAAGISDISDKTFILSKRVDNDPDSIQHVKIYPIPLSGDFFYLETIAALSGKKVVVQIFDINGTLVETKSFIAQNNATLITLNHLLKGFYLVRTNVEGTYETHRIIKL